MGAVPATVGAGRGGHCADDLIVMINAFEGVGSRGRRCQMMRRAKRPRSSDSARLCVESKKAASGCRTEGVMSALHWQPQSTCFPSIATASHVP
eukprot:1829535-Prymnesium_polylepis.1